LKTWAKRSQKRSLREKKDSERAKEPKGTKGDK